MMNYDVIIIGGGPGGYVAAIKSANAGKKTVLIEKEELGGTCLNWGCIPTKSLLRNAEIVRSLSEGEKFGFSIDRIKLDYEKAYLRSREVSAQLVNGISYLMKKNKVTVVKDTAKFIGKKEILLTGSKERLTGEHIIVAVGSKPFHLPILDYSKPNVLDSKKALQLKRAPRSITIIGAGAIGMEFATIFQSYGAQVHIVEMLPRILPNEDEDISTLMEKEMCRKGLKIYTGTKLISVENNKNVVKVKFEKDGNPFTLESEMILTATGVCPNTKDLNLEKVGFITDNRGYIEVDKRMHTSIRDVYAIGDVTGKLTLAHTASAQAMCVVNNICCKCGDELNYDNIPRCTYTVPELASVGLTEAKAREKGYDVETAVFPLSANGKAISYGDDTGSVKLIFEKKYGQFLGIHMAGVHVTEMIWGAAAYLKMEMTVDEMTQVVHPHPTVSEVIMEAAHIANGEPIHI